MNYQLRGLQISFVIHALCCLIIVGINSSLTTTQKLIKIDFSIEEPRSEGVASPQRQMESETRKVEAVEERPEVNNQQEEIPSPVIPETQPPVPAREVTDKASKAQRRHTPRKTASVAEVTATPHRQPKQELPEVIADRPLANNPESYPPVPASMAAVPGAKDNETGKTKVPAATEGTAVNNSVASREEEIALYLKKHFSYIRDLIQKSLLYPKIAKAKGWEGKVLVSLVVFEDGNIADIKVTESSGFALLDKNALETIKKASPFPKPPVKAELTLPIVYRLE